MISLDIATASRRDSKHWEQTHVDWPVLCGWMATPADRKECGSYLLGELEKTTVRHDGETHDCTAFHRNKETVLLRSAIVLDADSARAGLPDQVELILGYTSALHTTYRSTPLALRYRVIIPLDRSVTPAEYSALTELFMDKLGRDQFDDGCIQPERYMFLPSCDPAHPDWYESRVIEGELASADALLAEVAARAPAVVPVPDVLLVTDGQDGVKADIPADYVAARVAQTLADLDALAALGDGERLPWPGMPDGVGWDVGGLYLAGRLVEAGNTGNGYTLHDAREDWLQHSPPAEGTYDPAHKWSEAVKHVGRRQMPYDGPAGDFTSVVVVDKVHTDGGEMHSGQIRMAYRLAAGWAGKLIYVYGVGWYYWDGTRWAGDHQGYVERAVVAVLRGALAQSVGDKKLRNDVTRCESASGIKGIMAIAATLKPFAFTTDQMDADPWLVNTANGTLDLRDRELHPHSPADRCTRIARGAYRPEVDSSVWTTFLEQVLPDADERSYLQRVIGQAVYGGVREHLFPVLTGTGANGKGTAYGAVCSAFGDYATVVNPEMLMVHNSGSIGGPEMMVLLGARLVVASELGKERTLDDSLMKRLTGGDKLTARHLFREPVTWSPTHQLVYVTNHKPKTQGDDDAVWRRMRIIPFDVVIPEEQRDVTLGETLMLHADAVMTWAIAGFFDHEDNGGMREPASVLKATEDYRTENDDVARFVEECCRTTGTELRVSAKELGYAWESWARDEGCEVLSKTALGKVLESRGFEGYRGNRNVAMRRGLALITDSDFDVL